MIHISQIPKTILAPCALLYALCNSAQATVVALNPYSFSATTQYGINTNTFGSYTDFAPGGSAAGVSSVSGFGQPSPTISASNRTSAIAGTATADARVSLLYDFEVFGPAGPVQVNINSTGTVSANATPPGYNQGYFLVADSKLTIPALGLVDETLIKYSDTGPNCCFPASTQDQGFNSSGTPSTGFSGSFTDTQTLTLSANVAYRINMYVQASSTASGENPNGAGNGLSANTSATLDPTFTLAPSVTNPGSYTFGFSPGIGNSPVTLTPEPATYYVLGSGMALIAFLRRRRT